MTTFNRWALVALGVVLLLAVPLAVRAIPAQDQHISAVALLERVTASRGHAYTGEVETQGNLQLPVADSFTDIGSLLGQRNRMRVWWNGADGWRVDKLLAAGETDLIHRGRRTIEWSYEHKRARVSVDPAIRLPRTADLLPPALAQRLLRDVDTHDLSRLPAMDVAGRDALGLRLSPGSKESSIDHVDLWADTGTGLPLRVAVFAKGLRTPSVTSEFTSFSARPPTAAQTAFTPPAGADVSFDSVLDIADAANQFARTVPPRTLAGLSKSPQARQGVGLYGKGVTQVIAIPLWSRAAGPLRKQMRLTPGVLLSDSGAQLSVGPLSVLLTDLPGRRGDWLLAGTVTQQTLLEAASQLDGETRPL